MSTRMKARRRENEEATSNNRGEDRESLLSSPLEKNCREGRDPHTIEYEEDKRRE